MSEQQSQNEASGVASALNDELEVIGAMNAFDGLPEPKEILVDRGLLMPIERECCGTFPGTPHRATCAKYRGKFKVTHNTN